MCMTNTFDSPYDIKTFIFEGHLREIGDRETHLGFNVVFNRFLCSKFNLLFTQADTMSLTMILFCKIDSSASHTATGIQYLVCSLDIGLVCQHIIHSHQSLPQAFDSFIPITVMQR